MDCLSEQEWYEFFWGGLPAGTKEAELNLHLQECPRCSKYKEAFDEEQSVLDAAVRESCKNRRVSRIVRRISTRSTKYLRGTTDGQSVGAACRLGPGAEMDNYVVLQAFAPGGFGEPYLVYPSAGDRLKDRVVLKLLPEDPRSARLEDAGAYSVYDALRRIRSENQIDTNRPERARAAVGTRHIPLVRFLRAGTFANRIYLVMEYCPGGSLADLLDQNPAGIGVERTWRYMRDVVRAVCMLHSHGLSHNDIKPGNIFLKDEGAVLGDYSILSRIERIPTFGTRDYLAPERSTGKADQRSDVFSLGITMFELITGLSPEFHMDLPLKWDRTVRQIVEKAKKHNPDDRYRTAAALLADLDGYGVQQGWWAADGVTRSEARELEDAFIHGIALRLGCRELKVRKTIFKALGDLQKGNAVDDLLVVAAEEGKENVAEKMPRNQWVLRTFRAGRFSPRQVFAGACLSPLRALVRNGATTQALTQQDLNAAAEKFAARDSEAEYAVALFAPCGWKADCAFAEGPNWRAFPVRKREGTCWEVGVNRPELLAYKEVFDPETREQKIRRIVDHAKTRPELTPPDGAIPVRQLKDDVGILDESLMEDALQMLLQQDPSLEVVDLPGFGRCISRRALGGGRSP